MSVLRKTLLSTAALIMAASTAMAGEKLALNGDALVVAKLLILPGDNSPTGYTDLDSPARDVSLSGTFTEGSSSHNGPIDQISRTDIIDDADLGVANISVTKAHKSVIVKRKNSRSKKSRSKIVKLSIPRQTVKRRAPLMLGVYR